MNTRLKSKILLQQDIFARTHIVHSFLLSLIVIIFHNIGVISNSYMPLTLIITLLVFKDTPANSEKELTLMIKSLVIVLPIIIGINLWLQPYILTLPLVFLLLFLIFRVMKFPFYIIVPGILIIGSYFQDVPYWFYLILAVDITVFSVLAYVLTLKVYVKPIKKFAEMYKKVDNDFRHIVQQSLDNEQLDITPFFQRIAMLEELLDVQIKKTNDIDRITIIQLDQMIQEIQEAYFYVRLLIGYRCELSKTVLKKYEQHNWSVKSCTIVSDGIYTFHAQELITHYEKWMLLENLLTKRGLEL